MQQMNNFNNPVENRHRSSANRRPNKNWICNTCKLYTDSERSLNDHLNKMHSVQHLIADPTKGSLLIANSTAAFDVIRRLNIDLELYSKPNRAHAKFQFYCHNCNFYLVNAYDLLVHISSQKHKELIPGEMKGYNRSMVPVLAPQPQIMTNSATKARSTSLGVRNNMNNMYNTASRTNDYIGYNAGPVQKPYSYGLARDNQIPRNYAQRQPVMTENLYNQTPAPQSIYCAPSPYPFTTGAIAPAYSVPDAGGFMNYYQAPVSYVNPIAYNGVPTTGYTHVPMNAATMNQFFDFTQVPHQTVYKVAGPLNQQTSNNPRVNHTPVASGQINTNRRSATNNYRRKIELPVKEPIVGQRLIRSNSSFDLKLKALPIMTSTPTSSSNALNKMQLQYADILNDDYTMIFNTATTEQPKQTPSNDTIK